MYRFVDVPATTAECNRSKAGNSSCDNVKKSVSKFGEFL